MKITTPTLPASRGSLPPEGAQSALGRPGGGFPASMPPFVRTRIKICGLTREEDVDAAVAAGADAVGFVLYESSPRHVTASWLAACPPLSPLCSFLSMRQL
jgi:phosphoribosylanthranilate isomerase